MQTLNLVAKELFNKIRGRFPSVTIGDGEGNITTEPELARFYDFDFKAGGKAVGKISISLEDQSVSVVYNQGLVTDEDEITKDSWYDFLKELRQFAKKRMLNFDTRDINKSNLNRRDYKFLANNRTEEETMSEGKLYGTSKLSYQDFDSARLVLRHSQAVNQERAAGRTQHVESIYIESSEGERFKYPYKHINGARAMARHVAEGGKPFDEFGIHIVGLSEELSKLKTFKSYMGRSSVMAEGLSGYMDVVKERVASVKKTLESLQKKAFYTETFTNYAKAEIKEVPQDVAENWIDELTVRQFNEELKDVFPYIYSLVSENTRAKTLGPMDLEGYTAYKGDMSEASVKHELQDNFDTLCQMKEEGASESQLEAAAAKMTFGGQALEACLSGADNPFGSDDHEPDFESQIEQGFEEMMGQFAEGETNEEVEVSDEMRSQISDWIDKFSKYKGGNGDTLPEGYMQWALNSGIATDFFEENEVDAFNKKKGYDADSQTEEWTDEDHDDFTDNKSGASPITSACLKMLNKITGDDFIEDNAHIIDAVMHGDSNESFDPQSEPSQRDQAVEDMLNTYEKGGEKALAAHIRISEEELDQDINEWCAEHGKHADDDREEAIEGVIEELADATDFDEGDNDTMDVKIDKDGNMSKDDGKEEEEQKTPLGEFILSYFDRENGQFPKGETAVLTMVEKDYGEEFITPAKKFIEMINTKVAEVMGYKEAEVEAQQMETNVDEGTWAIPDTEQAVEALAKVMAKELPLGPEGNNATDVMYNIIGDDSLFDSLGEAGDVHPTADARPIIASWVDYSLDGYDISPELQDKIQGIVKPHLAHPSSNNQESQNMDRIRELAGLR